MDYQVEITNLGGGVMVRAYRYSYKYTKGHKFTVLGDGTVGQPGPLNEPAPIPFPRKGRRQGNCA